MAKHNKITYLLIFLVLLYSTYINIKIPTITEEFTGNIREKIRPKIRKYRNIIWGTHKNIINKIQNYMLKKNR